MHWKITALWGGKKVELRVTQRGVTPFGGLVVFFEFLRRISSGEAVRQDLQFSPTSANAIDPVETEVPGGAGQVIFFGLGRWVLVITAPSRRWRVRHVGFLDGTSWP